MREILIHILIFAFGLVVGLTVADARAYDRQQRLLRPTTNVSPKRGSDEEG